jgi:hypothetical protein
MVLRCRPRARAISDLLQPRFRSADSSYRSPEVSWRYLLMSYPLFLVEKEALVDPSSPQPSCLDGRPELLHLVRESKPLNKALHLTGRAA